MDKKLTFKEYLEKERNRGDILKSSSRLDEVLESARRINDISLSNSALKELTERNNKINTIINDSSFTALREAVERIKVDTSGFDNIANSIDTPAIESFSDSYKSLINSVSPISKIYNSELQKLKASVENVNFKSILNSESFIRAKELQKELIRFEPDIGIQPITTLEKSIESEDPNPFEKAEKEVSNIELVEQLKVSSSDTKLLDKNPFKECAIDILIITGLPLEFRIFCDVFNVDSRWHSDKFVTEYYFGSVFSKFKTIHRCLSLWR